jgi:hypothetical protein
VEQEWEHVRNWCLVASQAGTNGKNKVFLETSPDTIDGEDFDKWVANCLFTIRKVTPHQPTIGAKGNGGPAINDGIKRNQLMVAQWPENVDHIYTLNNCASQSGKKSTNAQIKRSRHCKSKNSKAE